MPSPPRSPTSARTSPPSPAGRPVALVGSLLVALAGCPGSPPTPTPDGGDPADAGPLEEELGPLEFAKQVLATPFYAEGASYGDFDNDGITDVVAGPYIWPGPDFTEPRIYRQVEEFTPYNYSNNFFAFPWDFDDDGWLDVLIVGFPGQDASLFKNPGTPGGLFERHIVFDVVDNEAPAFTDLDGDGQPDLVCNTGGYLGYLTWDAQDPTAEWTFHPISADEGFHRFTHGLGVGDVDGDGRKDVLLARGVWYQPADLTGDPQWREKAIRFGDGGGQIEVYDVDGDGDGDVITTLQAHGVGLSWFEQTEPEAFVEHRISGEGGETDAVLYQPHALTLADIDGDGVQDIVTGDRFWGHVPDVDPVFEAEANLYWFHLVRQGGRAAYFAHAIDDQSGVGTQVVAGDVNADGRPDLVISNKKGTFVFRQLDGVAGD